MDAKNSNKDQAPPTTYETPQGVYQGTPDSAYPFTAGFTPNTPVAVGGVILASDQISYNMNRKLIKLVVRNTGDRPIQVGSHFHFFEVNRYMEFDRIASFGYHLNIPATTAIRFEPGEQKEVELISYGGKRRVIGFGGLTNGYTGEEDTPTFYSGRIKSLAKMTKYGYKTISESDAEAALAKSKNKPSK